MSANVTEFTGKGWAVAQANKRVGFLVQELKNGGGGLTFEELQEKAEEKVPGGRPLAKGIAKRVAYGLDTGRDLTLTTLKDAKSVLFPRGQGIRAWEKKREKERLSFVNKKKVHTRYNKRKGPTVAEKRLTTLEVSPENIRRKTSVATGKVAEAVLVEVDKLKKLMELHRYSRLEIILQEGQPEVTVIVLPPAIPIVVHL